MASQPDEQSPANSCPRSGPPSSPQRAQGALVNTESFLEHCSSREEKQKGLLREGLTQRGLPGQSRGLLEEREHAKPPGAWLFQATEPESAEDPGSGKPPAHGEGQLSGRNWF